MKSIKWFIFVLVLVAIFCVVLATSVTEVLPEEGELLAPAQVEIPCYVSYGKPMEGLFTEPVEKGVFVFKNMMTFVFTNYSPEVIFYPDFVALFKKFGLKPEDCILHIHNHLVPSDFSEADKRFASYLRDKGFTCPIALYIQPTKEVKFLQ